MSHSAVIPPQDKRVSLLEDRLLSVDLTPCIEAHPPHCSLRPHPVNDCKIMATIGARERKSRGSHGATFDELKEALLIVGCDNAIFFDGSDSATLSAKGIVEGWPGSWKNETNTAGLAFYA